MKKSVRIRGTVQSIDSHERGAGIITFILFTLIIVIVCALVPDYTLGYLSKVLVVNSKPAGADAIVVLLGGEGPDRVLKADELFKQGKASAIAFSTGYYETTPNKNAPSGFVWPLASRRVEAALNSLGHRGDTLKIIDIPDAFDTARELSGIADYARKASWANVILVTSPPHTRRVDLVWKRVAPDVNHYTVASDWSEFDTWWQNPRYVRAVAYEFGALIKESWAQLMNLI